MVCCGIRLKNKCYVSWDELASLGVIKLKSYELYNISWEIANFQCQT